jgi:hypothetical protein
MKKKTKLDLNDFQKFLDKYAGEFMMEHEDTVFADVTDEGKPETIITTIREENNTVKISNRILLGNVIIWSDTLLIDNDLAFSMWDNDSVYYDLLPYSAFYEALSLTTITDSLDKTQPAFDNFTEMYLSNLRKEYQKNGTGETTIKAKIDSTKKALTEFEGELILTLHQLDRDVLIWNKTKSDFELFYSP